MRLSTMKINSVFAVIITVMMWSVPGFAQDAAPGAATDTGAAAPPQTQQAVETNEDYQFLTPEHEMPADDTAEPAPDAAAEDEDTFIIDGDTAGMVEKTGAIIKVTGLDKVYIDQGEIHGVTENLPMIIYRMEPIRDLDGEVLDEEEVVIGKLRVYEVRPRLSIANVLRSSEDIKRGFLVRYWLEEEREQAAAFDNRCPKGMMFDGGGPFVFVPGNYFRATPASEKQTEDTEPFCIDKRPADEIATWAAAREICGSRGKRLCTREEKQKVCATWDKPKPCAPELQQKGDCPEPDTIIDFDREQEWTADMAEKDGVPFLDANSCACPGVSPVCVHCYFEECRGAKKLYRCCSEPFDIKD